jgi:hypothetical protein
MALNRPEGYFYAQHDDGKFVVEENGPGLDAVRLSWSPVGNFAADKKVEFRMPLEVWNKVVQQKLHELAMQKARTAKVKS